MQGNGEVVGLHKLAPVTIGFTTAGIEIMGLYLLPGFHDLLGNGGYVFGSYNHFYLLVILLFIGLDEIELCACYLPFFPVIVINEDLIKHSLAPVIATVRLFVTRSL